jgi:type I site-specific deoxyribonuclease chain S
MEELSMLVKLGAVLRVQHGFAFKSEHYVENSSYRLVTLGNFSENNTFKQNDAKATYYGADFPSEFILQENDLIMPLTEQVVGLFGNTALIPYSKGFKYVLNQRVGKIICDEHKVDKIYLHYLLATESVKKQLEARASGTRQRNISPENIYDVTVDLPHIEMQRKIGGILKNIEDQIERNNAMVKRLQVLALNSFDYFSKSNNSSNTVILGDVLIERDKSPLQVNNVVDGIGDIPFFTSGETILYTDEALASGFNIFLSTGGNAKVLWYN